MTDLDAEDLFERDADRRLLDRRRREELGLSALPTAGAATVPHFGAESLVDEPEADEARPALVRVALEARPDRGLIPGAVVTVVATVHNDGETAVDDVLLGIALTGGAGALSGSFARDDVAMLGDALLAEGLRLGSIPAGHAVRIRFALRVLPGTEPVDIIPFARARGTATLGASALRLRRRDGHAAFDAPRPFFELETGEAVDDLELVDDAAEPENTDVSPDTAPALRDPLPPRTVDAVLDEPTAPAPPAAAAAPAPPAQPVRVPAAYVLARQTDAEEIRALERVFSGGMPHGLAALALLSSLAAVDAPLADVLGVRAFARSIAAALPAAIVAARMHRTPPPVVTADALATIRADAPAWPERFSADGPVLTAHLDEREFAALRGVLDRSLADPFLRGVQVLLAVAPRTLEGAHPASESAVRDALSAYRAAAGAWLMRVTVRRSVDRRYDPLTADDPTLHEAGRALVVALRDGLPA